MKNVDDAIRNAFFAAMPADFENRSWIGVQRKLDANKRGAGEEKQHKLRAISFGVAAGVIAAAAAATVVATRRGTEPGRITREPTPPSTVTAERVGMSPEVNARSSGPSLERTSAPPRFVWQMGILIDGEAGLEWRTLSHTVPTREGARAECRGFGEGWRLPSVGEINRSAGVAWQRKQMVLADYFVFTAGSEETMSLWPGAGAGGEAAVLCVRGVPHAGGL
jgi:hypothetical protein